MNKEKLNVRAYIAPQVSVYKLESESCLMKTSFEGDHEPVNPGGNAGDAKRNDFFDNDCDEEENEAQMGLQW